MFQDFVDSTSLYTRRLMFQAWLDDTSHDSSTFPFNKNDTVEWTWHGQNQSDFVDLVNDDRDVTFHRKHSRGTAVVRGTEPMSHDQHFWEIQMISPVYGTDMMVGIGTHEADMSQLQDLFVSRLGRDNKTWGFSYTGSFYHNGKGRTISSAFDQGSVIGMHLNMWDGTLSFYKNKKHLGVASTGLKGKTLYAMASSTAACSGMRILRSCSFPSSLQFLCCERLRNIVPDDKSVLRELEIPPGLKQFLENNLSWLLNPRLNEEHPCRNTNHRKAQNDCIPYSSFFQNSAGNLCPSDRTDRDRHATPSVEPSVNFIVLGRPGLVFHNCNRFQRRNAEHSIPQSSTTGNTETVEKYSTEDDDDLDDINTNDAKRRKYSYNYAVGLSDPDTDTEL